MRRILYIYFVTAQIFQTQSFLSSALTMFLQGPIPKFHSSYPRNPPILASQTSIPQHPIPNSNQNALKSSTSIQNLRPIVSSAYRHQPLLTGGGMRNSPPAFGPVTKTKLVLGYLPTVSGDMYNRQGRAISGAMSYAEDLINNSPAILPNVELGFVYNDTRGLADDTNKILIDNMANHNVAAFIGPEGPNCKAAANLASQANKPMISFHCTDMALANITKYPTFVRMDPSQSQLTSKTLKVLRQQRRPAFIIVTQKSVEWDQIGRELERVAQRGNLTVAGYVQFEDYDICCQEDLPCCNKHWPLQVLKQTRYVSTTYVFIGKPKYLVQFNEAMSEGLFEEGDVAVLYLSPDVIKYQDLQYLLWSKDELYSSVLKSCEEMPNYGKLLQIWKSLTVISKADSFLAPSTFGDMVTKYNSLPPFNFPQLRFPIPGWTSKSTVDISDYATHLFDSVVVYATALHHLIQKASATGEDVTIENLAKDGRRITRAILGSRGYHSVSGHFVEFNRDGDSRGKFTSFRIKNTLFSKTSRTFGNTFTCRHYLVEEDEYSKERNISKRVHLLFEKKRTGSPVVEGNDIAENSGFLEPKENLIVPDEMFSNWNKYYTYRYNDVDQLYKGMK